MTQADKHYQETGHNEFECWKVGGKPVTFCTICHKLWNDSRVKYIIRDGHVYEDTTTMRRVDKCYDSFRASGYTCGGCVNYRYCRMAERDNETLSRFIGAIEQR